jgi:hypothetical protein
MSYLGSILEFFLGGARDPLLTKNRLHSQTGLKNNPLPTERTAGLLDYVMH